MIADEQLDTLDPEQLRQALRAARAEMALKDQLLAKREHEVAFKQAVIDKLTHENAVLKRLRILVKLATNNASKLAGDNASTCPLQKELQAES